MITKGKYFYAPHRSLWGIWKRDDPNESVGSGTFIKDCTTKEDARDEVYRLNGWKKKN